jgi:hypothetical protein
MPATQASLDAINAAIASGERVISDNGQMVTFRSIDDLVKARSIILSDLAAQKSALAGTKRSKQKFLFFGGRDYQ